MKILLIEDELPAARQLTRLIQAHMPGAAILETLDSVEGAVRWFRAFPAPVNKWLQIWKQMFDSRQRL